MMSGCETCTLVETRTSREMNLVYMAVVHILLTTITALHLLGVGSFYTVKHYNVNTNRGLG